MTREPKPEACMICRRQIMEPEERQAIAEHRLAHQRRERRRAQWRSYKLRRKLTEDVDRVGALHALSCPGGPHARRKSCEPIPVYRRQTLRVVA
jgi:hypothetical protein